MQGGQNFILHQQAQHQTTSRAVSHTAVSSTTPSENDDEGIGSSLADLDSLTDLLPMMAPDLVRKISFTKGTSINDVRFLGRYLGRFSKIGHYIIKLEAYIMTKLDRGR